jgi:hypothetical protein
MSEEDKEIFEEMYYELDEYWYHVAPASLWIDIQDDMVQMVVNRLGMGNPEAYHFVYDWFDKRH